MNRKSEVFWATQRRAVPTAFRLFTGIWKLLHIFDSAPLCCLCYASGKTLLVEIIMIGASICVPWQSRNELVCVLLQANCYVYSNWISY